MPVVGAAPLSPPAKDQPSGMTALMWATFHGHLGIAQRLLDAGAEVNHADIVRDTTPLALSHTAPPFSALVPHTAPLSPPRFALPLHTSRGCKTDEKRRRRPPPAASWNPSDSRAAHRDGYSLSPRVPFFSPPLRSTCRGCTARRLGSLLGETGDTPLSIAADNSHTELAQLLLDRGASVDHADNVRDAARRTPTAPPPPPRVALSSHTPRRAMSSAA